MVDTFFLKIGTRQKQKATVGLPRLVAYLIEDSRPTQAGPLTMTPMMPIRTITIMLLCKLEVSRD
jgi:hypothetical protein